MRDKFCTWYLLLVLLPCLCARFFNFSVMLLLGYTGICRGCLEICLGDSEGNKNTSLFYRTYHLLPPSFFHFVYESSYRLFQEGKLLSICTKQVAECFIEAMNNTEVQHKCYFIIDDIWTHSHAISFKLSWTILGL